MDRHLILYGLQLFAVWFELIRQMAPTIPSLRG